MIRMDIREIIESWINVGEEVGPGGLPLHPEFVYRISGEWSGWSNFLGLDKSHSSHHFENLCNDIVEDAAFKLMQLNRRSENLDLWQ